MMATVTLGPGGELKLPEEILRRFDFSPDRPIRVIETRSGVLLIPMDDGPIGPELRAELDAWQELAAESWDQFPYEEGTGG